MLLKKDDVMNEGNNCQEYRELFPLYYNGSLGPDLTDRLELHFQKCPGCFDAYRREQPLYAVASGQPAIGDLDSHPDGEMLDRLVNDPSSLDAVDKTELEAHLSECRLCRDVVEKLAVLPQEAADLMAEDKLPILTAMSDDAAMRSSAGRTTDLTARIRRPLTAIIAAAVVILTVATMILRDRPGSSARVEGTFPSATRSAGEQVVFDVQFEEFTFVGRVYVDPEAGHRYSLQVMEQDSEAVLYRALRLFEFDTLGFAQFEAAMKPGRYRLVLYDVVISDPTDTIEMVSLFELRLSP